MMYNSDNNLDSLKKIKKRYLIIIILLYLSLLFTIILYSIIFLLIPFYVDSTRYNTYKNHTLICNDEYFGSIKLPSVMNLVKEDNWYYIKDTQTNDVIAIQIYDGIKELDDDGFLWVNYNENSLIETYNYDDLFFVCRSDKSKYSFIGSANGYYKIIYERQLDMNHTYSMSFLFVKYQKNSVIKNIANSFFVENKD